MTMFSDEEPLERGPEDFAPTPEGLDTYARIEGLTGEERRLMAVAHDERTAEQHERLRAIGAELDRAFEKLRERAERLGGDSSP
jgi:Protein of unknown function (DUF2630)